VGSIAGPLLGGVLSDALGYRAPFYAVAALCAAGGVASLFLKEVQTATGQRGRALLPMFREVLASREIKIACTITALTTVGLGLLEPMLPLRLSSTFKLSKTGIGLVFGLTMLLFGAASPLVGKASDSIGRKRPILFGLLATAVLTPFLAVSRNLALVFVLMGALGVTMAAFSTPSLPLVTDSLGPTAAGELPLYGTAFGLTNLFWSLGYAIGPILGGAIVNWSGLLAATLMYSGLVVVAAVVVFVFLREPRPGEG